MFNVASIIGSAGKAAGTFIKSDVFKKVGISTLAGAAGVAGQKLGNTLVKKGEKVVKKTEDKKKEKNIKSWSGMSCEDLI